MSERERSTTLGACLVARRYNEGDSEHDLLFLAEDGNALRVTVQAPEGVDEEPFIGVGLPGTSLFDENYFPDQFNSQCEVELTTATPTAIEGSFDCNDLERGDAEQTHRRYGDVLGLGLKDALAEVEHAMVGPTSPPSRSPVNS